MGRTERYETASKRYQEAMNKYSGEAGWNLALERGKEYAAKAGDAARGNSYKAARTAGYGKAASYQLANEASNNATANGYTQGVNTALANNADTINAHNQNVANETDVSKTKFDQALGMTNGMTGSAATIFGMFSDERLKDIYIDMSTFTNNNNKEKDGE